MAEEKREIIVKVEELVKSFGDRIILNGVTLEIPKGEIFVIMGGSGCGKSTLLRHMIGSLKPDSGRVSVLGQDITDLYGSQLDDVRKKIGMSFQSSALFDSMTVGENVRLPLKEHTKLDKRILSRASFRAA